MKTLCWPLMKPISIVWPLYAFLTLLYLLYSLPPLECWIEQIRIDIPDSFPISTEIYSVFTINYIGCVFLFDILCFVLFSDCGRAPICFCFLNIFVLPLNESISTFVCKMINLFYFVFCFLIWWIPLTSCWILMQSWIPAINFLCHPCLFHDVL